MRDNSLLLTDEGVAADAFAANALAVNKTGHRGIWLQFKVTKSGADADERLDITIYGKDSDSGWATTDDKVGVVSGQIGSGMDTGDAVVKYALVMAPYAYIKPHYDVSGTTPDWDIECSVVSGPQRDTAV
jgi:hypothetical protein